VLPAAQRAALDARKAQLDEDNHRAALELAALQQRAAELSHKEKQRVLALQKVQEEAQRQLALQKLGRCVMGYAWQKVSGGYRCCGGSSLCGGRRGGETPQGAVLCICVLCTWEVNSLQLRNTVTSIKI
jgi:multidrug efflux pump subunit AcrA (membrane-fusion protein)